MQMCSSSHGTAWPGIHPEGSRPGGPSWGRPCACGARPRRAGPPPPLRALCPAAAACARPAWLAGTCSHLVAQRQVPWPSCPAHALPACRWPARASAHSAPAGSWGAAAGCAPLEQLLLLLAPQDPLLEEVLVERVPPRAQRDLPACAAALPQRRRRRAAHCTAPRAAASVQARLQPGRPPEPGPA